MDKAVKRDFSNLEQNSAHNGDPLFFKKQRISPDNYLTWNCNETSMYFSENGLEDAAQIFLSKFTV